MTIKKQRAIRVQRRPETLDILGMSRSAHYDMMGKGLLPSPISLGARSVGWLEYENHEVLAAMAAGKSKEEIKALVASLVEQRQELLGVAP